MGKIDIKGDIVSDDVGSFYEWFGMSSTYPKLVQDAIANDEDEEITLNIASNGGDVFAASEIYTMLKASGKRIVVNVQGLAASAASVISMAGDTVRISPTAHIMIHKASTGIVGNSDDLEHQSAVLNSIDENCLISWLKKHGLMRKLPLIKALRMKSCSSRIMKKTSWLLTPHINYQANQQSLNLRI